MKLSRVLAPIVAATVILTGCGGPSESDCTKALNKYLQNRKFQYLFLERLIVLLPKIIGYLSFQCHQMILS